MVQSRPHRLREIESPLTWIFCFLAYAAVRTKDTETRDMLTYARLVIREAQCHGGPGWLEYDKWFRQQQAALAVPHSWHELNASLHAATVMSLRLGNSKACKLCREPDHAEAQCALALLQPPQPTAGGGGALPQASRRVALWSASVPHGTRAGVCSPAHADSVMCLQHVGVRATMPKTARRPQLTLRTR